MPIDTNGINIQIYALVSKIFFVDFLKVQDKIFLDIAKEFDTLGIKFAVNPTTVKIENKSALAY
jgi:MscS family membrane protein